LLDELGKNTVAWRPSYDGTRSEPVVLPSRLPNLLINGSQGIAVGMATSIPPHNLGEVVDACIEQIKAGKELLPLKTLLRFVKGPDFPTGGQLFASKDDLTAVYETGQGTLKLRGEYKVEETKKGPPQIVITSLPYGVIRGQLVEKIAEIIVGRKLAALTDVRDESTHEVRLVLEIKKGTDPALVMAYLYKNTPLQTTVPINMTCLVPATVEHAPSRPATDDDLLSPVPEESAPAAPERLSLGQMIRHFLDFRMLTVERRLAYDLGQLKKRIHLLEGFEIIFDALDETIRIIRKSDGKADAAQKLIARFKLSEEQVDAILELRLYRLAKLEILVIQQELAEKRKEAATLSGLLKSEVRRWALIEKELQALKAQYADKRRTKVIGSTDEQAFTAEDFIVAEDATVVLTQQGWLKRAREVKDLAQTRVRDGDAVLGAVVGSTRSAVALFSSLGACYVMRLNDVPATTGYGEPVQKFFKMDDGEKIVAIMSFDPRVLDVPAPPEDGASEPLPPYALAVTRGGLSFRFSLSPHRDPSTRAGRKYCRLNDGDEVLFVSVTGPKDSVMVATSDGHALGVKTEEVALVSGVAKGAMLIKLDEHAKVVGAALAISARDTLVVETPKGKTQDITLQSVLGDRADKGQLLAKRDGFARVIPPAPQVPSLEQN
jgi:DNA gyrase subunit A